LLLDRSPVLLHLPYALAEGRGDNGALAGDGVPHHEVTRRKLPGEGSLDDVIVTDRVLGCLQLLPGQPLDLQVELEPLLRPQLDGLDAEDARRARVER